MGVNAIAAFWGFAEATLFFIVPDVWLTAITVRLGRMAAFRAAAWTIAGALFGGALMYDWGTVSYPQVAAVLDFLRGYGFEPFGPFRLMPYRGGVRALLAVHRGR